MNSSVDEPRPQPHNIEAEQCVLGAILINNHALNVVVTHISALDFYRHGHRQIFGAMLALHGRQSVIDPVTLRDELAGAGYLDESGGPAYVACLTDGVPRSANAEHYARIVKQRSVQRAVIERANAAAQCALEDDIEGAMSALRGGVGAVDGTPVHSDGPTLTLTPASAIAIKPVQWVWQDRLALGTFALLGGREGIGKSALAFTLMADLTHGRLAGVFYGIPKNVIVSATEDSWAHTIVPRLMAAGANLDRVFRVDAHVADHLETPLSLPRDMTELARKIAEVQAAALLLDPLLSRLDTALDSHKDAEVRTALEPLVSLGDASGCLILGLIHVNKGQSTDALTTLMGSRAFAAVARAVLFVIKDPDNESIRLLGQPKNNLGRHDLPTLTFQINGVHVADTDSGAVWTGQVQWLGQSDRTIGEAIEQAAESAGDKTATSEAADWLGDYLTGHDGPAESAVIKREAAKVGHSREALRRARGKLGVLTESYGFPRRTFWLLSASRGTPGRIPTTVPTVPTVPTDGDQGRHREKERVDYPQSAQSAQSAQSNELSRENPTDWDGERVL